MKAVNHIIIHIGHEEQFVITCRLEELDRPSTLKHVMLLRKYKEKQYFSGHSQECVFLYHLPLAVWEFQFEGLCVLGKIAVYMSDIFRIYIRKSYVY